MSSLIERMLACDTDLTVADTIKDLALCYVDLFRCCASFYAYKY